MSNSSTVNLVISNLNMIQLGFGRYVYPIIFILGNIGSILNVLILTQRVYRHNSCCCYILASSVTNLFIINFIVLFHSLALGFNIDPTTTSLVFCKFRQYFSHITTILSRFYIILAFIDRWAMSSTSARYRAWSHIRTAKLLIPTVALSFSAIALHIPFNFQIVNGQCIVLSMIYTIFYNIYNTILSGFLTPSLMAIFGLLTIRNINRTRRRVNVQGLNLDRFIYQQAAPPINVRSREYQILMMILVQLAVYLITCLPFPMYLLYSTITLQWSKNEVQLAVDRFLAVIAYVLGNINFSATFYIYILTTRVYRKDLKRLFLRMRFWRRIRFIPKNSVAMSQFQQRNVA